MKQKLLRREAVLEAVKQAAPAQIIREVLGGDATETRHPGLQTGVVAVDALDMPDAVAALAMEGRDEGAGFHAQVLGDGPVGSVAVCAQDRIRSQQGPQGVSQGCGRGAGENLVKFNLRPTLHRHNHRRLLGVRTVLGLARPLLRGAGHALLLPLVGNREERFVGFHHAGQGRRLLLAKKIQKLVTPAERLLHRNLHPLRCLADGQAIHHASRVLQQLLLVPQAVERGAGQGREGFAAVAAAEPLRTMGGAELHHLCTLAVRAAPCVRIVVPLA